MRKETVILYSYDELPEAGRERVRDWFNRSVDYFFFEDAMIEIKNFADLFGIKILDYEISPWNHSFIKTSAENANFRGLRFKDAKNLKLSCGYYIGEILQNEFLQWFKDTGSAYIAFNRALDAGLSEIVRDWENHYSEESIRDFLTSNEYEFLENGEIWH